MARTKETTGTSKLGIFKTLMAPFFSLTICTAFMVKLGSFVADGINKIEAYFTKNGPFRTLFWDPFAKAVSDNFENTFNFLISTAFHVPTKAAKHVHDIAGQVIATKTTTISPTQEYTDITNSVLSRDGKVLDNEVQIGGRGPKTVMPTPNPKPMTCTSFISKILGFSK